MIGLLNMYRSEGVVSFQPVAPAREGVLRPLARVRFQLLGGLLLAVLLPALLRTQFEWRPAIGSMENTVLATAIAMILGIYAFRKMLPFPGVQATSFILPAFGAAYALIVLLLFFSRIDYSRFQVAGSFLLAVPWFMFTSLLERHFKSPLFAVLPVGNTVSLTLLKQADWTVLQDADHIPDHATGLVADLRADLSPQWEKLLAASALQGLPVYHSKHVSESLTGRVEIEHLSENSLGSLL